MAIAAGLGFLTKGPVVLVLPLLAMVGLRTWRRRASMGAMRILFAMLIFLTISFSWFILLKVEDSSFADYFFFQQLVDRVAHAEVFARAEPWYYYLPLLPLIYLPWIGLVIPRAGKVEPVDGQRPMMKSIAIWWFFCPLALFSIFTSKLVLYILPLSIGFSLLAGYGMHLRMSNSLKWVVAGPILLVYSSLILVPFLPPGYNHRPAMVMIPLIALLITIGTFFYPIRKELVVSIWSLLFASTLVVYSAMFFRLNSIQVNSTAAIAAFIRENRLGQRNILVCNEILPSLAFELDKDIIAVDATAGPLKRETRFEKDDRWRDFLMKVSDRSGSIKLRTVLSRKAVVIAKKQLAPAMNTLMTGHWQQKKIGQWTVYYN
jgi:4-amino-4-deoxy-L-arabinose transferase